MFYPLARWIVWGLLRLTFRVRVEGLENLPRQGSLILAANHASYIDPPLLGAATPRRLYFMAKRELFTIPLFGALIRRFGAFPVRRGALDRQAIRSALELLARGEAVVLFPEGTRHRSGGLLPGQQGVAMLASRSGAPIVPVGLVGTRRLFRRLPV
ncbi:MAG TPA: lysophospholipid acyltransferase family protein, partial [Limnochordia bacterium]